MKTKILGALGLAFLLVCGTASAQEVAPQVSCVSGCQWPSQPSVWALSTTIATATTTLLVSNTNPSLHIYAFYMGGQTQGTNTTNTIQWEYGTGVTCGTNTVVINPTGQPPGGSANAWLNFWASASANGGAGPSIATQPFVVPAGNNLCGVTAGTTTSFVFATYYTIAQ